MAIYKEALLVINTIPYPIVDANRVLSEQSSIAVDYERNNRLFATSLTQKAKYKTYETNYYTLMNKSVNINIQYTTGSAFFNTYNILKAALEGLVIITAKYPTNTYLNYVSYWGLHEYLEYGVITGLAFSSSSSTNTFNINLDLQSYTPLLDGTETTPTKDA